MDGKQITLSLFPCRGRDGAPCQSPRLTSPPAPQGTAGGSSISPLLHPHLEDGDSGTTRGFSKGKSLLMTGGCFTTAAGLYPRVTQSSRARRKPHSTSAGHRNGVTPHADEEQRPREIRTTAGSQEQASTVIQFHSQLSTA